MRGASCVSDYRALAKARLPHFLFAHPLSAADVEALLEQEAGAQKVA